jgi:hypothetical protein
MDQNLVFRRRVRMGYGQLNVGVDGPRFRLSWRGGSRQRRLKGLCGCTTYQDNTEEEDEEKSPTVIKFVTSAFKCDRYVQ